MAHDPVVALVLWALGLAGVVAALVSLLAWHFPLTKMLPVLGAVVVLLGSYFAARTLRDNELARATEMLGSDSLAARLVGIHQLGQIGMYVPRFREYAKLALCGFLEDSSEAGRDEASRVDVLEVDVRDAFPAGSLPCEPSGSDVVRDS